MKTLATSCSRLTRRLMALLGFGFLLALAACTHELPTPDQPELVHIHRELPAIQPNIPTVNPPASTASAPSLQPGLDRP